MLKWKWRAMYRRRDRKLIQICKRRKRISRYDKGDGYKQEDNIMDLKSMI
jgi:hypothetical protein